MMVPVSTNMQPPQCGTSSMGLWISIGLREFPGQALRNCPVGNFSEGASLQGKRIISCLLRGPE